MRAVALRDFAASSGRRAGADTDLPVYSVTKHAGFVPSLEYFKKQVFSRELDGYRRVAPGEFAYATIHLDEGSIGIAPEEALISPMYTVFRVDDTQVDPDYLIRFLKSPRAMANYATLGKGAVHRRKAISLEALGSLSVPLPPLDEQRRIAAILDQADAIRAKRRQVLAHLGSLTQSVFQEMFGGGQFELVAAGKLLPSMRNGVSPSKTGTHTATVLTLSAVTRGAFDPTAVKESTFAVEPPPDQRVSRQDFLICRGNGNKRLVGVGAFSPVDRHDLVFPDTVIAGRVDTRQIDMTFLDAAWKQPSVRRQIESTARTTNGTFKVNQQGLSQVVVPVPPLPLQAEFAQRVVVLSTQARRVAAALAADYPLFASLQSRAFGGGTL